MDKKQEREREKKNIKRNREIEIKVDKMVRKILERERETDR